MGQGDLTWSWPWPCSITSLTYVARADFLQAAASCLAPTGVLILSNWRFTQHSRLRRKIVPWERVGLTDVDVDAGDYLLSWQANGEGYRYVHQLDEAEVESLAERAGLRVIEHFHADGREGDVSLYSILAATQPSLDGTLKTRPTRICADFIQSIRENPCSPRRQRTISRRSDISICGMMTNSQ